MRSRLVITLAVCLALAGCSDSDNDAITVVPEFSVDPESIDVTQAAICDITQSDLCLFPFPNDFFSVEDDATVTGKRVRFDEAAMPVNSSGVAIDPAEFNRNDGFSIGPTLLARVEGIDLQQTGAATIIDMGASLDTGAPIQLINADTGERQLIWAELDQVPAAGEPRALMIRMSETLDNATRYIVVLQNVLNSDGVAIESSDAFKIYQQEIPSDIPELEARRAHFEALFSELESYGVSRDDLYLTWDFTTASIENTTSRILHMRDTSLAGLAGAAPNITIDSVVDSTALEDPNIGRQIDGTLTVPNFMDNAAASPASNLNYTSDDPDALPQVFNGNGSVEVPFVCVISQAAFADAADGSTDAQAVVVGHGLFGNRFTAVGVGFGAQLTNAVFCAVDWWGMSDQDVGAAFAQLGNLSLFPQMPDRLQQALLNKVFLSEAMVNAGGFLSMPEFQDGTGNPLYRAGNVQYNGISMGSVYGGTLSAISPHFDYSVLDLAGMNWALTIRRGNVWSSYAIAYEPAYPDPLVQALGFSLIQMVWDRADSNGYSNHITRDALPGSKLSRVLIHSPIGDQILTETAAELMQRSLGAARHTPTIVVDRHIAVEPYIGIDTIPAYPYEGNAVMHWDSGPFPIAGHDGTPLQRPENLPRLLGYDTHGMPIGQAAAWAQKAEFWRSGQVINVCGSEPCYGDGYDGTPGVYDPANAPAP